MAEVAVRVGGRPYALSCRAGGEARLMALAARIDAAATELTTALGAMAADRLLLAAAITLVDRLDAAETALERAADRTETLAAMLETSGRAP